MLDEFESWKPVVRDQQISIGGPISNDGIRRLFSILSLDAALPTEPAKPEKGKASTVDLMAEQGKAGLRYFKAVNRYLDSLQQPRRPSSYDKVTLWLKNYAHKIDRLPKRNVDPELIAYGTLVADSMRDAIAVIHGVDDRTDERISGIRPRSNIRVGAIPTTNVNNYGGYRVREYAPFFSGNIDIASALAEEEQVTNEERERGKTEAADLINEIRYQRDAIATKMSKKYSLKF